MDIKKHIASQLSCQTVTFRTVLNIYIPLFFDQLFITAMAVFSASMVSGAGMEAVSAVNMVESVNLLLCNVFLAIGTGGTVVIAQYTGRVDTKSAGKAAVGCIQSSALFALFIGLIIMIFSDSTLQFLFGKAQEEVLSYAKVYLVASCISYPFYAISSSVIGSLRGRGDSKGAMLLSVVMNVSFFFLNFTLITICKLGVLGISISLIVTRVITAAFSLFFLLNFKKELGIKIKSFFKFNIGIQKRVLMIGLPTAAEQMFFHGGKLLTQSFVVSLGTASLAAYSIGNAISSLYYIPGQAMMLAATTIVGICIGAGKLDDARKMLKNLMMALSILFVVTMSILLPLSKPLLYLFHAPELIHQNILNMIFITAFAQPVFWARSFVCPSGLRASGDVFFTTISALICMWLVRVVLGYILGIKLNMGVEGVYLAMVLEWSIRATVFSIRFRGDKWYRHKII